MKTNQHFKCAVAVSFLFCLVFLFLSCEKKVPAPAVTSNSTTSGTTTSGTTTGGSTTGSGTTGGSTTSGSTTGGSTTSGSTTGGSTTGGSTTGGSTTGGTTTKTLTFWSNFQGAPIDVYVNGSYKGQVTAILTSAPSCNTSGCVNVSFSSSGSVSYTASDGDHNWSGTVSVSSACTTMLLKL